VSFEIQRMPVKSNAKPLQLPAGAVVDLDASGTDQVRFWPSTWYATPPPVQDFRSACIMFSPTGAVDRFYTYSGVVRPVPGGVEIQTGIYLNPDPIFLLVGRRERVTGQALPGTPNADEKPNWADMGNLWVTLNPQTGLVSVGENSQVNATENPMSIPGFDWSDPRTWDAAIRLTRQYARQAQSVGGR
jgi:hypothetical protein